MKLTFAILAMLLAVMPASAAPVTISGEVTYRERIALPPNAVLSVQLVDVSLKDGRAPIRAEARIASKGQVPLTFTLHIDDAVLVPGHSYALSAEISADNRVWFRNTTPHAIDPARLSAPAMILVNLMATPPMPPAPEPEPAILDVFWRAQAIDGAPVLPRSSTSLTIASDLRAGGKGGCNSYFAQAELDGTALQFSAVASTRMSCEASVNDQEMRFFSALSSTRGWRIDGDELLLLDARGQELARLVRSNS